MLSRNKKTVSVYKQSALSSYKCFYDIHVITIHWDLSNWFSYYIQLQVLFMGAIVAVSLAGKKEEVTLNVKQSVCVWIKVALDVKIDR